MILRTIALGLCLAASAPAATSLPPILISAGRTSEQGLDIPTSAIIIDRVQIDASGARSLTDILRSVASIHVSDSTGDGANANIDMRGFGATAGSNVAILIDGRKINPATDSATLYLNSIDLDRVEQIEIVEGSAGTLYGNQAVGGLINVIMRRPGNSSRQARVGAGSYHGWELQAGITERLGEGVGVGLQAQRRDSDNYRDHSASRLRRFGAELQLDHAGGYSYADLLLLDEFSETPGALLADELAADRRQAVFPDDYLDTRSRTLTLGTRSELSPNWRLEAELALRDDHRAFVQSFRFFPGTRSTQDRESLEVTPRLIGRYGGTVYTLGVDFLATDYELQTTFGPQRNDQSIAAFYGQVTHPLSARLSLTGGIRHARVDNDIDDGGPPVSLDDALTVGSLGLVHRPAPAWRLFVRADQNYRFAKVDEHSNVVFGQPVGLNNQTGISYETGVGYNGDGFSVAARAFQLRLKDEISFDTTTFTNVNLPHSRRNGLALSVDGAVTQAVALGAAYEYLDATITSGSHSGSRVPLVPRHRATAHLEYRPRPGWLLRLDVEYVGEQFLGADYDNSSPPLAAYTVGNLVARHVRGDWHMSAKVNNLFDQRYSETGSRSFVGDGFNPAPERNVWIEVGYQFEE